VAAARARRGPTARRAIAGAAAALACTACGGGCSVGPDFVAPTPPEVASYEPPVETQASTPPLSDEGSPRLATGQTIAADWWTLFHSSDLDDTLRMAIGASPTLAAARASLAQAREAIAEAQAGFFPTADVGAQAARHGSGHGGGASPAPFDVTGSAGYTIDLFGETRRSVEQQQALAENERYGLAAAYLALTGGSASEAIAIASLRAQLETSEALIADDERNLALVERQFEVGKVARADVLSAQTQLASDRTDVPVLRQELSVARHALAALVGQPTGAWSPPSFDLQDFTPPGELPLSLPSALAHQRPDILAAEAQLHAASAAIGVATAQMYPSVTLSADVSAGGAALDQLFRGSSTAWSLAAGLTAPLLRGGALQARKDQAVQAFEVDRSRYQAIVLQAFQQVADTLSALEHDEERAVATRSALEASDAALVLQRASYASGKSNVLQLIDAERSHFQARQGYVTTTAQRLQDTVDLFVALGGAWWNVADPDLSGSP